VLVASFSVDIEQEHFSLYSTKQVTKINFLPWKGTNRIEKCLVYFLDMKSCSLGVQGYKGMFWKPVSFIEDFFIVLR